MQSNFPYRVSNRQTLEAEFNQVLKQRVQRDRPHWRRRWAIALVNFLTGVQTLSIREQVSSVGHAQWVVYDPDTDTRRVFETEQAVRAWLEKT